MPNARNYLWYYVDEASNIPSSPYDILIKARTRDESEERAEFVLAHKDEFAALALFLSKIGDCLASLTPKPLSIAQTYSVNTASTITITPGMIYNSAPKMMGIDYGE